MVEKETLKNVGIGLGIGVAVGVTAPLAGTAALGLAGFSPGGVVAGSVAAGIQSSIGSVAAGSLFAGKPFINSIQNLVLSQYIVKSFHRLVYLFLNAKGQEKLDCKNAQNYTKRSDEQKTDQKSPAQSK